MTKEKMKCLLEEQNMLKQIMQKVSRQLEEAPEGTLVVLRRKEGKNEYYCERQMEGTRKREYLNSEKAERIKALAQKKYNSKLLGLIEKKYTALNAFLEGYPADELKDVLGLIPDGIREHVTPIALDDKTFIADWYNRNPGSMNTYPLSHMYRTNKGEYVRSKSEKIIADIFDKYNVPYVYEPALTLENGKRIIPDFKILNIRTRKEYVYEHLGMLDSVAYANDSVEKIRLYEKSGYIQGKNIFYSFESSILPLDAETVERIVKEYFL